jgi:mono/diheme cytochrome c family protein
MVRGPVRRELRNCHPDRNSGSAIRQQSRLAWTLFAAITLALPFSTSALAENAAEIYKARCSACHGANGAGDTMLGKNLKLRSLASDEVQKQSDSELSNIISKGKNRMPPFDRRLSKDQIAEVVKYIRSLKK